MHPWTCSTWTVALNTVAVHTTTIAAGTVSWSWYQPIYATTYSSTILRRYGGGFGNEAADKVRGYCISMRKLTATANTSAGIIISSANTTLSGASALTATAIAFGVAALAV